MRRDTDGPRICIATSTARGSWCDDDDFDRRGDSDRRGDFDRRNGSDRPFGFPASICSVAIAIDREQHDSRASHASSIHALRRSHRIQDAEAPQFASL